MKNLKDANGNTILGNIIPDYILQKDGNLEAIAEELNVSYAVLYKYVRDSEPCQEMLQIVRERAAQRAERALADRVQAHDTKAITFALQALKPEIYGESKTVTLKAKSPEETERAIKNLFGIQGG